MAVLLAAGCGRTDRDALSQAVLDVDPAFEQVLQEHEQIVNRIETYYSEWQLKKVMVEQTIEQLQEDVRLARKDIENKIERLRNQMNPQRARWEEALNRSDVELRELQAQRATLGRSITKLRKVVQLAGEAWPEEERLRQEDQLREMLLEAERLEQEIAILKQHREILRAKLLLTEVNA